MPSDADRPSDADGRSPAPLPRPARVLFVGGHGHHYLARLLDRSPGLLRAAVLVDPYDPPAAEALARRLGRRRRLPLVG